MTKNLNIPKNWYLVKIGDNFTFKNGLNKEKSFFGKGTPIINILDVFNNSGLTSEQIKGKVTLSSDEIRTFGVRKGDVLFARTSETIEEIGMSSVVLEELKNTVFSGFLLRGRPTTKNFDVDFTKYCFHSSIARKQIISLSSKTTRALTNGRLLSKVVIPIPKDLKEQHSISVTISDIEELILQLQALIEKKKNIKKGTMQELLTGKRRLEGFSEKWETKQLGIVSKINTGKKNEEDKIEDGKYPFFVRSQTVEHINTYSFDGEAILVPGEGGIGSIFHYINGKFDYHQRVYKISDFTNDVKGKFIYYSLKQNFNEHAMKNSVKATVDSLRLPTFQEYELFFPKDIEEQNAISNLLSDMDYEIKELEKKKEKYKMIKQGMMQKLLTGEIRLQ